MAVLEEDSVLREALTRVMLTETPTTGPPHYWPIDDKLGSDRDEGYYGFCKNGRRPYRGQILEANNDTELRRAVQQVADRYIKRTS